MEAGNIYKNITILIELPYNKDRGINLMDIKPSTLLRNNYNAISAECKRTGKPIFLTRNGEGDLVVMSMEAYEEREKMLDLREKLLEVEEARINGEKYYSVEELVESLNNIAKGQ